MSKSESHGGSPAPVTPGRGAGIAWVGAGILMLAGMLVLGILPRMRQQNALAAETQEAHAAPAVLTSTPHIVPADALDLPGDVQAIEETTVSARASGYLSRRLVDIGSRVKAGDLLAEIEVPEVVQQLVQAKAQSERSQATIGQANAEVERSKALAQQASSETARLQAAEMQAKADVAKAEAQLEQAKATELNADSRLETARHTLDSRTAAVSRAKSQSDIATKTLNRWRALARQGAISQQDLDQKIADSDTAKAAVQGAAADVKSAQSDVEAAQHTVSAAKADVQAAQAGISAAQHSVVAAAAAVASSRANSAAAAAGVLASRSNVHANRADLQSNSANVMHFAALQSFSRVVAPFSGIITARNVDVGALINAGGVTDSSSAPHAGLFGIARTDVLRIQVSLPQSAVSEVKEGQLADITVQQIPGKTFQGAVYRLAGALDTATRTQQAEIHIDNKTGELMPGMYARVRFAAKGGRPSLRIASNVLVVTSEGTRVAVVGPDAKIHFVVVKLGRDYGMELEVLEGLRGGENLVSSPGDDLHEGDTVRATPAPAPPVKP